MGGAAAPQWGTSGTQDKRTDRQTHARLKRRAPLPAPKRVYLCVHPRCRTCKNDEHPDAQKKYKARLVQMSNHLRATNEVRVLGTTAFLAPGDTLPSCLSALFRPFSPLFDMTQIGRHEVANTRKHLRRGFSSMLNTIRAFVSHFQAAHFWRGFGRPFLVSIQIT